MGPVGPIHPTPHKKELDMSRLSIGVANELATLDERVVTLPTGTQTLDPAKHANRLLLLSTADAAYTINLPRTTGSGDVYRFLSTIARTSGSIVINAVSTPTSNKFVGRVLNFGSANVLNSFASTTNDIYTLNNTTQGGALAGDYLEIQDTAVNTWTVLKGLNYSSGAHATPFSG